MKKDPMSHDRKQDAWLGATLRHTAAPASDACLDAETLAAWADGGLSPNAAAAVESHAAGCSRCTAVLAAMERTAPAAAVRHAWTPGRLARWLVPLTAAATAVAIWVAVPDRSMAPIESRATGDFQTRREGAPNAAPDSVSPRVLAPETVPPPAPAPERGTLRQNPAPEPERGNQSPAQGVEKRELAAAESTRLRDDSRNEGASEAAGAPAAVPELAAPPPAAAPSTPAASSPPPAQERAADSVAGLAGATAIGRRAEFAGAAAIEATAPGNPQFRWRVVSATSIERSTDGGKTWTRTLPLPADLAKGLTIAALRAANDRQAIARMSDGSEFYTSNGGTSWVRLQEKSPAPF